MIIIKRFLTITMLQKLILTATLLTSISCSYIFKPLEPPSQNIIESANYGEPPNTSDTAEMKKLIIRRLKDLTYFDPNSAEVEECSAPDKSWEYDLNNTNMQNNQYIFGWKFLCDVNVKNRMGGYTGFHRSEFLFFNNKIIGGDQFHWTRGSSIGGIIVTPTN